MSDDIIIIEGASLTLTLESVPISMAGAAGGALQTAQRIGAAIGTAVLATICYEVLTLAWARSLTGREPRSSVKDSALSESSRAMQSRTTAELGEGSISPPGGSLNHQAELVDTARRYEPRSLHPPVSARR